MANNGTGQVGNDRAGVPVGARTSEYYRTNEDLPPRFDKPDNWKGYNQKPENPMFRTTSNDYGKRRPNVHTMPTVYYPIMQKFTENHCANYRNFSLNVGADKGRFIEPYETGKI